MVPETLQSKQFELANTPMKSELYLGLDVHKEWILVAVAEWGRNGAVHDWGAISNDLHAVEKLLARLRKRYGHDVMMRACYEAGPCGFGLRRRSSTASLRARHRSRIASSVDSLPGEERLERGARALLARTDAAAPGHEGDAGGVLNLGAAGQ
jgi:hypothetical protein